MDFVDVAGKLLPAGWSLYEPEMGLDSTLECPHGSVIEQDGTCPEGCTALLAAVAPGNEPAGPDGREILREARARFSPLRGLGLI